MKNPRNATTILSCALVFFAQLGSTLCLPVLPQIGNDIGLTEAITSLSIVVFFAGCAAPILAWGVLADRYGRRVTIVTALILFSVAAGVAATATTPSVFLAARTIQGAGAGGMAVVGRILIADIASAADLAKRMSLLSFTFVLALGGGQFLGGVIQEFLSWRHLFMITAASGSALLFFVQFIQISSPSEQILRPVTSLEIYWRNVKYPPFFSPVLVGGLGYGVLLSFQAIGPFIFQRDMGISARQYGDMGVWISFAYLLGSICINKFAHSINTDRMIRMGLVVMLTSGIGLACMFYFDKAAVDAEELPYFAILLYCSVNFAQAIIFPSSMASALSVAPENKGRLTALCSFSQQMVASIMAGLASLASPFGMPLVIGLVISVSLIGLWMTAGTFAKPPQSDRNFEQP